MHAKHDTESRGGAPPPGGFRRLVLPLLLAVSPLGAETFVVQSSADLGDVSAGDGICDADPSPGGITCTLRAAVMEANSLAGSDTIQVDPMTVNLSMGDLEVTGELLILGQEGVIIDGGGLDNLFEVQPGGSLEIRDVILRNGKDFYGGCVRALGHLTLIRVEIHGCTAENAAGANGGGGVHINGGDLRVVDSWIHDNDATDGSGGGIAAFDGAHIERTTLSSNDASTGGGAALWSGLIVNSSIYDNQTTGGGGGLRLYGSAGSGAIHSSTIVANRADWLNSTGQRGGGVAATGGWSFRNTVIANNNYRSFGAAEDQDCDGTVVSEGYNFLGIDDSCTGFGATGDQVGSGASIEPWLLGPTLGGGLTPSFSPRFDPLSPLIDAAEPGGCRVDPDGPAGPSGLTPLLVDQRNRSRGGTPCDIGSVETGIFTDGFESGNVAAWSSAAP